MGGTKGSKTARWSKSQKAIPSSDCGLQFARMKSESVVIADQHAAVNMFLSLYTPPVKPRELVAPEVADPTARGEAPTVRLAIGTKS